MNFKKIMATSGFQVISHRGNVARYPENTIEGFIDAIKSGVDGLEMDLVVSGDKQIVVSHEPYMSAAKMLTPTGKRIDRSREREYNLYKMPYESIRQFKAGLLRNPKFRNQEKIEAYKPLLDEVFERIEQYKRKENLPTATFYLELKSNPEDYNLFQPYPEEYVDLVMHVIRKSKMQEQVIMLSFDANFLNILRTKYPEVRISYLISKTGLQEGLGRLNFKPDILSPNYKQLKTSKQVKELQHSGIKVIPWTVNSKRRIVQMIALGVDGIISDYPERLISIARNP